MTFMRLNHLQERRSINSMRMFSMLYMQLEMIMTNEYIFVCVSDLFLHYIYIYIYIYICYYISYS